MFRSCWILQSRDSTSILSVAAPTSGQDGIVTIEGGRKGFWPHGDHTLWSMGIYAIYLDIQPSHSCFLKRVVEISIKMWYCCLKMQENSWVCSPSLFRLKWSIQANGQMSFKKVQAWRDESVTITLMLEEDDWTQAEYRGPSHWSARVHTAQTDGQKRKFTIQYLQPSILAGARLKDV